MAQQPHFSLVESTPPAVEPVDLDYLKQWLRIDGNDHNPHLRTLLTMARELCSDYAGRAFITTGYTLNLDRFPMMPNTQYSPGSPSVLMPILQNVWPMDTSAWAIKLPRSPLVAVSSITYIDVTGNQQTLAPSAYQVDATSEPARIAPVNGGYWPGVQWRPNAVTVTFTAGYGTDAKSIPAKFRMAIAACVGHWYDSPNAPATYLPDGVKALLDADPVTEQW